MRLGKGFPLFYLTPWNFGAVLSDCSVDSTILADSAVSSAGIQDSAVTTVKLNDGGVTYAKIQNITGARLFGRYDAAAGVAQEIALAGGLTFDSDAGTISSDTTIAATLSDSQVDSSALADSAVSTLGLQDCAVTFAKIQNITAQRLLGREDALAGSPQEVALSAELGFDTVNDWLEVSDSGIINGLIADSAITTAKISDSQITTAKILDSAVTYAKIQNVTAQRLLGRWDALAGSPQEVSLSAELRFDSGNDWLEISDSGILNGLIADSAVDSGKIADSAVGNANMQKGDSFAWTGGHTFTLAGLPVNIANNSDSASVEVLRLQGDRAAFAANDAAFASLYLSDTGGTQKEAGRLTWNATDASPTGFDGRLDFAARVNDTLTNLVELGPTGLNPFASDRLALGNTSRMWSDLFLASLGVINFNNGNAKITHSAGLLTSNVDIAVPDEVYSDSWNASTEVPTKNAVYDKIQTIHTKVIYIHATDTSLAVGDTLATFFVPAEFDSWDLVRAEAAVKVVSTSGRPTIQIRDVTGAADMLVNKITIDSGEKTSYTSDTASSIDTTNDTLLAGQEIAIDVDSAGTGTEDLYVILSVRKP